MEQRNGVVLWFTGLSGSGKTTTSSQMASMLRSAGNSVEVLDGDELRATICTGLGFSREDRMESIKRITYMAKLLSKHGIIVIISAITPYQEMRDFARRQLPSYLEVYVKCTLEECERRDVKGLYKKARRNEIRNFTGISDPYEEPKNPEITIDTLNCTLNENCAKILQRIAVKEVQRENHFNLS